jgi:phospholipid-binding lipoprotein MlaA
MQNMFNLTKLTRLTVLISVIFVSGCATVSGPKDERDPLEGVNRAIYEFNDGVDRAILKPVAQGYNKIMPGPVDKGVTNFFANLDDVITAVNNLLQFKLKRSGSDAARVLVNSTIGLLGFIDVASSMGLDKHNEDFGQTLGYWGVGNGPYLVLPFLGPSTLRDTAGLFVDDALFNPLFYIDHVPTRNSLIGVKIVDTRAALLGASNVLEEAALDKYDFHKESYFQKRDYDINDGALPFP